MKALQTLANIVAGASLVLFAAVFAVRRFGPAEWLQGIQLVFPPRDWMNWREVVPILIVVVVALAWLFILCRAAGSCWRKPGRLAGFMWAVLAVMAAMWQFQHFVWGELVKLFESPPNPTFALLYHSLIMLLILGLFRLVYLSVCEPERNDGKDGQVNIPRPSAYPSASTKLVGAWLLLFGALSVLGLLLTFNPPNWPKALVEFFQVRDAKTAEQINEALITIFGAGIGSLITTLLAFLRHASEKKDYDRSWEPWYVARPIMGMMLALIFYFLLKGGMFATLGADVVKQTTLNPWSLAGIGALVGMFSKNAI